MARKLWIGLGVLTIAMFATVTSVRSQEDKKGHDHAGHDHAGHDHAGHDHGEGMDPAQAEMMKMWEEAGKLGPQHERFKEHVGAWKTECKAWMGPGEPETSYGTSKITLIMDGHYVEETFNGEFGGQPFQGRSVMGYDNAKKKYVSTWIDSMSTGIASMEGDYNEATKTFTSTGKCCVTGADSRLVCKEVNKNTRVMEMYSTGPDGKEMKSMEITYTRM